MPDGELIGEDWILEDREIHVLIPGIQTSYACSIVQLTV